MEYVTIKKAVRLTNVSESTIRRLIAKSKRTKQVKKVGSQWLVSTELLSANYKLVKPKKSEVKNSPTPDNETLDLIVGETFTILKEQIKSKDTQINSLLERNRELNILLRESQNLLNGGTTPSFAKSKIKDVTKSGKIKTKSFINENKVVVGVGAVAIAYLTLMLIFFSLIS